MAWVAGGVVGSGFRGATLIPHGRDFPPQLIELALGGEPVRRFVVKGPLGVVPREFGTGLLAFDCLQCLGSVSTADRVMGSQARMSVPSVSKWRPVTSRGNRPSTGSLGA